MNIPDKVRIGSMDYKVIQSDETLIVDNKSRSGMIDYKKHEIRIRNDIQDTQGCEVTLLHEIVHGIVHEGNFNMQCEDEELKVEELGRGLHQVIRDNPGIFKEGK